MFLRKRCLVGFLFFAVLFFFSAGISIAATYYVAPDGNDNNSGAIDSPWQTVDKARNAVAGDTVYFRNGIYSSTDGLWPKNNGTVDNPIVFAAYPGETPSFRRPGTGTVAGIYQKDYITFDGLTFNYTDVAAPPTISIGGTGLVIKNCIFQGKTWSGLTNVPAIYIPNGVTNGLIQNNLIQGYTNTYNYMNTCAIMIYHTDNLIIENNTINNNNYGLYIKAWDDGVVVRNNFFSNNYIDFTIVNKGTADNYQRNHEIYNNIFLNTSSLVMTSEDDGQAPEPINNIKIYNNTIYNSKIGFTWDASPQPQNIQIWNNIFANNTSRVTRYEGVSYSDSNNYFSNAYIANLGNCTNATTLAAWQGCTWFGINSVEIDPGFINPSGSNPEDYKRTSYPANGRGGNFASVMGAYITGNEVIGYTPEGVSETPGGGASAPVILGVLIE